MIRTDLAAEAVGLAEASGRLEGVEKEESQVGGVTISRVRILDERGERAVGKPRGVYVTLSTQNFARTSPENLEDTLRIAAREIARLAEGKTGGGVLVVGLGNAQCTPDALGPKTAEQIFVTRHMARELSQLLDVPGMTPVSSIAPGVLGQTGVETGEIVRGLVERIHPSLVLVIDALAARSMERLGSTVQLSDTGIAPGSGVGNHRQALSEETLGVPVVSIGVPTVVDAVTLATDVLGGREDARQDGLREEIRRMMDDQQSPSMVVTPREIDVLIEHSATLLSMAINRALHPSLESEDLAALTGA